MTFDEAIAAARAQKPVVFTRIDGCDRLDIIGRKIVQVGFRFKDGVESEYAQVLDNNGGCIYHVPIKEIRLKEGQSV